MDVERKTQYAVALTLAYVLFAALWPRGEWVGLCVLAALLAGAGCGLGARWREVAREMGRVEVFALGVAAMALFQKGGMWIALEILAKAHMCVAAMAVMGRFVSFAAFLGVLKAWGFPETMLLPLALMERYRGVLAREWRRLWGARQSRTFAPRGWRGLPLADTLGALLARSLARAERIAAAMFARGWGGG